MNRRKPPKPTGSSEAALFMQAAWDELFGQESQVTNSASVKWYRGGRGRYARAHIVPSTPGSGGVKLFRLIDVAGDYLICKPINGPDGAATGTDLVNVLKEFKVRNSAQTIVPINGVNHHYSFNVDPAPGDDGWIRGDDVTGEQQIVIPRWIKAQTVANIAYPGDEIKAAAIPSYIWKGETYNWIEITQRAWARIYGT